MPILHQIASIIHLSCDKCTSRDFIQLFSRLFLDVRKVAYALLTHPPLVSGPKTLLPFDLHVLSLPQAFILSQDQTLHCKKLTLLLLSQVVAKFVCLYATYSLIAVPQKPLVPDFPSPSTRRHLSNTKTKVYALFQSTKYYPQLFFKSPTLFLHKALFLSELKDRKSFQHSENFLPERENSVIFEGIGGLQKGG